MSASQITYLFFGLIISFALVFDLGFLSKKNTVVSMRRAIVQTFFWVLLALLFFIFLWLEDGRKVSLEFLSSYLMEWSLSIDNIFVFIIIFSSFGVKEKFYGRVLLIGILMAIIFRVIFITIGFALLKQFHWIIDVFGALLYFLDVFNN